MPQLMRAQTPSLTQLPNSDIVRVYPYVLTGIRENVAMFGPNTISFVAVSQNPFNDEQYKLQVDEDNNFYFTAIAAKTKDETISASSDANSFIQTIYTALSGYLLSNDFPYQINKSLVITFDKPMAFDANHQQIRSAEDKVFLVTKVNPTIDTDRWYPVKNNILEEESYSEIMISETEVLKNRYTNCEIKFYHNDIGIIKPLTFESKPGVTFSTDKGALLANNFISVIGKQSNETTRIETKIVNENIKGDVLFPIKADNRFISSNQLGMYFDWFDKSLYLPFDVVTPYGSNLDISQTFDNTIPKTYQTGAYNLIYDMLTATNLFLRNFSLDDIVPEWRLKPTTTNPIALGQIDPKWNMGTEFKRNILQISNQSPQVVVDGMYNEYVSKYSNIPIEYLKLVKSMIAALSRVILSNFSFTGGNNDALKSIVPWYLRPQNIVVQNDIKDSINLIKTTFTFQSEFFNLTNNNVLTRKNDIVPNATIEIQGEQTQFIPKVPASLPAETAKEQNDKEQLPAAMLSNDDNALEWYWYMGIRDSEDFSKVIDGTGNGGNQTIKLVNQSTSDVLSDDILDTEDKKRGYIISYYRRKYGSTAIVDIVSTGSLQSTFVPSGLIKELFEGQPPENWRYWNDWGQYNLTRKDDPQNTPLSRAQIISFTSLVTNVPESNIQVPITTNSYYSRSDLTLFVNFDWGWNKEKWFLTGVSVNVTFTTNITSINKLIFTRTEWRNYIRSKGISLDTQTYFIEEINGESIDSLDEVMLTMIWDRNSSIGTGSYDFTVNSFNSYDETVALTRVSFT